MNSANTQREMAHCTVEWAPFALAEGVEEATLLAAAEALQRDFLSQQPGFIARELLKGAGNEWVDLLYWASQEAAAAAMQTAGSVPACQAYFSLMVPSAGHADLGSAVRHLAQVRRY